MNSAMSRMLWAHSARIEDPTVWRTLVVLADMTNDAGLCWPSISKMADLVMRSERTVRNALDTLAADGFIQRHRRRSGGQLRGYLYRICAPGIEPVSDDTLPRWLAQSEVDQLPAHWLSPTSGNGLPVASGNGLPVDQRQQVAGQELALEVELAHEGRTPSSTDVDQPALSLVGEREDDRFDELWETYPRRNGRRAGSKAKARQRWKALTRHQRLQVFTAVDNYRRERAPTGNGQYVMDLARFLGTEWETWVEPAAELPVAETAGQTRDPFLAARGPGWR